MQIDLRNMPATQDWKTDVCIIGAGAAGITLALELMDSGLDVLVLESGGMKAEPATQALYAGTVSDEHLHSPPDKYRQRRLGGSTTIWGGRCMPFDEIDFESRSYVAHSGWPMALQELQPFYARANQLCEAGEYAYTIEQAFNRPMRPMIAEFHSNHFTTNTLERFSCPTDFAARYGHLLRAAKNVRLVLHANVTRIQLNGDGLQVESITASTLPEHGNKTLVVKARHFVLATGGIEVARMLLANRDVHAGGIGNHHDVVGRYYMCHLAGTVGTLTFRRSLSQVWHGYDVSDDGVYCRRRLALRPDVQRAQGIGNFIARLHHPRITLPEHRNAVLSLLYLAKPLIPYEYGKRLYGEEGTPLLTWLKHLRNVLAGPFDAAGFAWHMLRDRKLAERKFPSIIIKPKAPLFSLDFHAEQEPNPASRITLGNERDALGIPRVNVDWRYTSGDVSTVSRAIALLAGDIEQSGAGTFDYDPASLEFEMTRYGAYGGHHIGTARMGIDERSSVVNADCRVHGVNNLYISSAAVFPTSSQANPTLTIVALALRMAAHLRNKT
ncbi:MAG TPA: GMC family oxidoreductase [Steroidobacteraceae bacterium]|nr:GMC family oxidoreductase [Steroidobacteraceae bacterium]